ncbi:MAG: RluA family pseudouridine synthase [Clostridia bacterium]|nr:RluA family pseudouridine synthase [Clostridia bacterium]
MNKDLFSVVVGEDEEVPEGKILELKATDEDDGLRLDVFVSKKAEISRSQAQELIEQSAVLVNGKERVKKYKVVPEDTVTLRLPEAEEIEAVPQDIPIDIVYEDEQLLVVNKPKGMVVHPAVGNPDGTLVNALLFRLEGRLSSINGKIRPGIVHRIDKDTAGLLIVAKTDDAHKSLALQIAEHSFSRCYEAIVCGNIKDDSGTVIAPIGRHRTDRKRMAVVSDGRNAVTHYKVLKRFNGFTHLRLKLETGRTHQIRVHMAHLGHPVAGDQVYGDKKNSLGLEGQCLFAKHIGFVHPKTNDYLEFEEELPEFFVNALKKLEKRT